MKNFRTLELSKEFYQDCEQLGLKGNFRDQLLRAASSISLNLSEGNAKRTVPEKKRFFQIAYASTQECKTILELAKVTDAKTIDNADKLGAWTYNLMKSDIRTRRFDQNVDHKEKDR